jgi:acyl dehydratase
MSNFLEDYVVGETVEIGSHRFTREDILSFASRFDPQLFHIDEAEAEASIFGKLCASGWHTACVWMRLMAAHRARVAEEIAATGVSTAKRGPSPGIKELKWIRPVYVDDVVTYRSTVQEARLLKSKPEWGLLITFNEGLNQNDQPVISFVGQLFVERRGKE